MTYVQTKTATHAYLPLLVFILIALLAFGGMYYVGETRSNDEFNRYSVFVGVPLVIPWFAFLFFRWSKAGFPVKDILFYTFALTGTLFAAVGLGGILYSVGALMKDIYLWLHSVAASRTEFLVISSAALTLGLGWIFFYFRLRLRCIYGLTEVVVGLLVAANHVVVSSEAATNDPASYYLLLVTAGVYLVVRGFDNIHQGLTKDPLDPIARTILERSASNISKPRANAI